MAWADPKASRSRRVSRLGRGLRRGRRRGGRAGARERGRSQADRRFLASIKVERVSGPSGVTDRLVYSDDRTRRPSSTGTSRTARSRLVGAGQVRVPESAAGVSMPRTLPGSRALQTVLTKIVNDPRVTVTAEPDVDAYEHLPMVVFAATSDGGSPTRISRWGSPGRWPCPSARRATGPRRRSPPSVAYFMADLQDHYPVIRDGAEQPRSVAYADAGQPARQSACYCHGRQGRGPVQRVLPLRPPDPVARGPHRSSRPALGHTICRYLMPLDAGKTIIPFRCNVLVAPVDTSS
ncbi:hypothetical protein QJS66_02450 [Kocuria rhizophila]|nr:hypothetical protein QJS66_02450 [Kocuria rhizophila]